MKWWLNRGALTLFTAPLGLLLLAGTMLTYYTGLVQTLAYYVVLKELLGAFFGWIVFFSVAPFSLLLPGYLWVLALKVPEEDDREVELGYDRANKTFLVAKIITFAVLGQAIQWAHGHVIGWLANR